MAEAISEKLLRTVYAVLALAAGAALLHTTWLRRTPAAFEPGLMDVAITNYDARPLQHKPPLIERDYAHGTLREWMLDPRSGKLAPFKLMLTSVHSREEGNFEISALAKHPALPLVDERSEVKVTEGSAKASAVSVGGSGDQAILQSCIVPGAGAYTGNEDLIAAVNSQRTRGWRETAMNLAGLQPNVRWECLLVTISLNREPDAQARLLAAWEKVYPTLAGQIPSPR